MGSCHDTRNSSVHCISVKSLNFMRGRTFVNKFLIIDEAQNLTPKQMKTLITRAGPGTKIVCLGNIAQIDTPYLTEGSSGLTYVVDRFRGWEHGGHVMLARGDVHDWLTTPLTFCKIKSIKNRASPVFFGGRKVLLVLNRFSNSSLPSFSSTTMTSFGP